MRACCANWGTSEKTRGPRAGLRPAHVSVQGDEPHRRSLHAGLRARGAPCPRGAPAALGDARRAALLSSLAPGLERRGVKRGFARQPDRRRMVRRAATPHWAGPDVRLLPERARAAPLAARRCARGPVRCLWGIAESAFADDEPCFGPAGVRETPACLARVCSPLRARGGERCADRPVAALR